VGVAWAYMGEMRNVYNILVRKAKGSTPLGRYRYRWGIIVKCVLKKQGGIVWTVNI
jgi:hypothetical protein